MTNATITLNAADALADIYDARRTKFWVIFNTDSGRVTDADGVSRLGAGEALPDAAGIVTLTGIPVPSGATNPTNFQVMVCYDAPAKASNQRDVKRERGDFGWMTVTGDANLKDLEAEQYAPPNYLVGVTGELAEYVTDAEAARDAAVDISNISTPDSLVQALVKNTGGAGPLTSAALSASIEARYQNAGFDFAPLVSPVESTIGASGIRPIGSLVGIAYGAHSTTGGLYYSTDGSTWTQIPGFGSTAADILDAHDGEVIINSGVSLYRSSGWANPATATFTLVLTSNGTGTGFIDCAVDTYDNLVIAADYGSHYVDARYVYVSTDHGATFTTKLDLNTLYPSDTANTHWHSVCIDPYAGGANPRLWASHGDGPRGIYYSDNLGGTWTLLRNDWQPMPMIAAPGGLVLGTDGNDPDGIWVIPRSDYSKRTQLYRIEAPFWSGSLLGFGTKAVRDPATGVIYVMFRVDSQPHFTAGLSAMIFATDGVRASLVYSTQIATAPGQLQTIRFLPPAILADGTLLAAYLTPSGGAKLIRTQTAKRGIAPTGPPTNTSDRTSVSLGVGANARGRSVALGSGTALVDSTGTEPQAVVVGDGATAGTNSVVIGLEANSPYTDTVVVGRQAAATAGEGTAVGSQSRAAQIATALGRLAKATALGAVAVGHQAQATGTSAVGVGKDVTVSGDNGVGVGQGVTASGFGGVAVGYTAQASAHSSSAFGYGAVASVAGALALGRDASAAHSASVALGRNSTTTADNQVAFGSRHLELATVFDPGPGVVGKDRIWIEDNGLGKKRLMVRYGTDGPYTIHLQP